MSKYRPLPNPTQRCNQKPAPTDTTLITLNLDATDYATLMTARYFFASFANPNGAAWLSVVLCSQDFFPDHSDSPAIVQAVLEVVHKIRTSRTSMLRFSNPHCLDCANIVTAAERHLITILRNIRSGNSSGAATHAMLLCEGHETAGVLAAAARLTQVLKGNQAC
jgi:hypothetical protein